MRYCLIHALLLLTLTLQCFGSFSCDGGPGPHKYCLFDSEHFECDDGSCVCKASQCDGDTDCADGSDEVSMECDTIIAGVIGGVAGLAFLCCVLPCICCCCYCLCRRKKNKLLRDNTPPQTISTISHVRLSAQRSADIQEATDTPAPNNVTTEV